MIDTLGVEENSEGNFVMKFNWIVGLMVVFMSLMCVVRGATDSLPVRGIHFSAPNPKDVDLCAEFIRDSLAKEGVNTLVLEFNYNYQYTKRPELAAKNALNLEQVKTLLAACADAGIQLIPQINCLGHQSWDKQNGLLLQRYPEFDETPNKYPDNEGIYCRSYCPLHPEVHAVMFDLIDELADACEAAAFHVGMDEVFILADEDCPRCQGKETAELFALEVNRLHEHLKKSNRQLWMWGDRFLDGNMTGIGKWEASQNDTASSIDRVPRDIMICDWHYERAEPTAVYFAVKGFPVLSSPWRKTEVALGQLEWIDRVRRRASSEIADRMKGVLQTTWCGMVPFIRAYRGETEGVRESARESAACFKALFAAIRESAP